MESLLFAGIILFKFSIYRKPIMDHMGNSYLMLYFEQFFCNESY